MSYIQYEIDHPNFNSDGKVGILDINFTPVVINEVDAYATDIDIEFNGKTVCIDDLPPVHAGNIENTCDAWCYENAHDLWYEEQIMRAEAAWESMQDR